ncbi:MAG: hypothetical protein IJN05_11775 [Ruminococcus sp.]|nr:hypothetical protein [Ruminococcus sp.]
MIASPVSGLYILKNGGKCGIIYDVGQTDKSKFVEINIRISFIKRGADHLMLEIDIRKVINIEDGKLFYHDFNDTVSAIDLNAIADHHQKKTVRLQNSKYRSVGEREYPYYYLDSPNGITLYLEIPKKNWFKRFITRALGWNFNVAEQDLWYSIQVMLNENGYTTLDLS